MFALNLFTDHFFTATFNTFWFWGIAIVLLMLSYMVLDKWMMKDIHFLQELKAGNMAVALVIAAFLLAIGLIIFGITN